MNVTLATDQSVEIAFVNPGYEGNKPAAAVTGRGTRHRKSGHRDPQSNLRLAHPAQGAAIGKFMTYYEAPHSFSREEMDFAVTIAQQVGFSIERTRSEWTRKSAKQESRESEERFRLMSAPVMIWLNDATGKCLHRASSGQGSYCALIFRRPDLGREMPGPFCAPDRRGAVATRNDPHSA